MTVVRSQTRTVVVPGPPAGSPGAPGAPGANVMAIGLFTALSALTIPTGTTLVQTSGHGAAGVGPAILVEDTTLDDAAVAAFPNARGKSANGRYFRVHHEQQLLDPHQFGCVDCNDGTIRDTGAALQAMHDYLHAIAINPSSGGGFYKGTAPIAWGRNHFHSASTTLEPQATIHWLGCGSGRWGPDGGAASLLSFGAGCTGIRNPGANTTGDTATTGTTHDAPASFTAEHMRWKGGFVDVISTPEGDFHGFVPRAPFQLTDIFIENFQGEGIRAYAGTVTGVGSFGGNLSASCGIGVKIQNCRGGLDGRGSDYNVVTWLNCEAYQNRRFGVLDDNGAGSNSHIGWHCASNGMISNIGVYTQTSTAGNRYALTPTGNPLNAPSGTTADTPDWDYIEAGAAIANLIPTYAATPGLFRFGGDFIALNNSSAKFDNCYSEYGGFSFFSGYSRVECGTIGDQYHRGGIRLPQRSDAYTIRMATTATFDMESVLNSECTFRARDLAGVFGYMDWGRAYGAQLLMGPGGNFYLRNNAGIVGHFDTNGFYYDSGGNKVVGARQTGWTASTGTPARGAFAAAAAGTASATYVQAELQGALNRIAALEARLIAAEADLRSFGIIN
jgi:hypothetical protein